MLTKISDRTRLVSAAVVVTLLLLSGSQGAEPEKGDDVAAERLEFMLSAARRYNVAPDDNQSARWPLHAKPLLRWSNPFSGVRDGVVVMWTDGARPAILAQVFPAQEGPLWFIQCQSLAAGPFALRDDRRALWEPRAEGEKFHLLDDAEPPAESRAKRLMQMRALGQQFAAFDDFRIRPTDEETTRYPLRFMTNPIYRYETPEHKIIDGAVFPFVLGTAPELLLVLEARQDDDETRHWEYLLAPLTVWAVEVKRGNQTVWKVAERFGKHSARDAYHSWALDGTFDR
ncbi:MAG TPA: hypothetical protein VJ783_04355 [Pirellulales bacterium]|nr:hypothetical protein [Pirellulales bacterium]